MDIHPIAQLFPPMSDAAFAELRDDIAAHGQIEPVWYVREGDAELIIDGVHRAKACAELGIELRTRLYEGNDAIAHVIGLNLHRRQLAESQRAMVAARLANMAQGARTDLASIEARSSQPQAAALLNVSRSTVQRATIVQRHGVPELVQAVERGDVKLYPAAQVAKLPPEEQRAVVAAGAAVVKRAGTDVDNARRGTRIKKKANNVVRIPITHRVDELRDLIAKGHRADQVAALWGVNVKHVRTIAHANDIELKERKGRAIDPARSIRATVNQLDALAASLSVVPVSFAVLTPEDAAELADIAGEALAILRRFHNGLKDQSHGNVTGKDRKG